MVNSFRDIYKTLILERSSILKFKSTYITCGLGTTMYAGKVQDYKRMIVAGFTVLIGLVIFLLESLYRVVLEDYLKLVFVEEYSYLIVVLFSVIVLLYYLVRNLGLSYEVRISKVLVSVLLASLSLVFYVSRLLDMENSVQYGSISLILIMLSLIILVYNPVTVKDIIPLLSLFILVPLPTSLIDLITPHLSKFVGRFAALLSGATFVEGPAYARLVVETPSGPALFDVEVACTGIVTLSSVLAVVPVIVYLVVFSPHSMRRKLIGILASLSSATLIGLLGNILRVVLVVWSSASYGIEVGMEFFHYTPSAIYSAFSALVAFLIADKYAGLRYVTPRPELRGTSVEWGYVVGVLATIIVLTSAYTTTLSHAVTLGYESVSLNNGLFVDSIELSDFMSEPPKYVFSASKNLKLVRYSYNSYLTRVLGAFSVYEILITGSSSYTGYVEVAETPGRFHTWQLCLTLQGFEVLNSWSKLVNGTRLYFIEIEKKELRGVLGYVLVPVTTNMPEKEVVAYVRVSLMKLANETNINSVVKEVEEGLLDIVVSNGNSSQGFENILYWSILTSQALMLILVVYLVVIWSPNLIIFIRDVPNSIRRWLRDRSWSLRRQSKS